MRILIGNHVEQSLLRQVDQRMIVHRIFWLAQEGDLIILPCLADEEFVIYVMGLLRIRPNSLRIIVTPPGCFDNKLFDPLTLVEKDFIEIIKNLCEGVTDIIPLWPSSQVARFAKQLGLAQVFPGTDFFLQGGDELANSKSNFRAFASSLQCPIAPGAVCRTAREASSVMQELFQCYPAVVVKQSHSTSGAGNQIVYLSHQVDAEKVGMKFSFDLLEHPGGISEYLEKRWDWASCSGRFPVVIEAYISGGETVYAEFYVDSSGVQHLACGSLTYKRGSLVQESSPLRCLSLDMYGKLVSEGRRLAELYRQFGYRGYLSADALYDGNNSIWFTEVNARIGGSPHIYQGIAGRVVCANQIPYRIVTQFAFNKAWNLKDTQEVLSAIHNSGLAYQVKTRRGVLLATPPIHYTTTKPFMLCIVHDENEDVYRIYEALDSYLLQLTYKPSVKNEEK